MKKHAFIVGISSDIGIAIAENMISKGISVSGTYRNKTKELESLSQNLENLFRIDLSSQQSICNLKNKIQKAELFWDFLIIAPGTMLPIGDFLNVDFREWKKALMLIFLGR